MRHRFSRSAARPAACLKGAVVVAAAALLGLQLVADGVNAALRPASGPEGTCRVLAVIDGDTVTLWCPGGPPERARLMGYDSPELFSPGCAAELIAAERAKWALRLMILGAAKVGLQPEGRDRYGRALVRLTVDGHPVAARMIEAGHGRPYDGGRRRGWCG